jgi:hypothetical protein
MAVRLEASCLCLWWQDALTSEYAKYKCYVTALYDRTADLCLCLDSVARTRCFLIMNASAWCNAPRMLFTCIA